MRYTREDLDKELLDLNHKLWFLNARYRLVTDRHDGYVELSVATEEQMRRYVASHTIATGTPRECLAAANAYVVKHVKSPHDLKLARHN